MNIAVTTHMQRILLLLSILLFSFRSTAQTPAGTEMDTTYSVKLKEVTVKGQFKNDTDRYRYNQMKHYVIIILPYLNAATKLFKEINTEIEKPDITRKERKHFIAQKEDEVRTTFEDKVKALNVTQGALLVKLIARQTEMNIYQTLTEFKNPITAIKWQTWARFNGLNLNKIYEPEDEPMLENIMEELGYPLPAGYANRQNATADNSTN
jgi:hypothetical protein